ncbi:MAG: prepilin-type N-terminal cleavage/methylation domain-containing protein [Gemmatimonadota bacterium]|nr:prepilin-type N-terminal cleavage/methylation domain-containing protein [Gemmatimonadota bacterium]
MRIQRWAREVHGGAAARRGITLIEVVVALTMFAIVTVTVASFTAQVASGSRGNAVSTVRAGALAAQVNRLEALPYDTLPSRAGCTSVSGGLLPRTECVGVRDIAVDRREVTFILRPDDSSLRPDTVILERTKPKAFHPLNLF